MDSPIRIAYLLRFRDDLVKAATSTIAAHNDLLRKKGKVWLGKFGLPVGLSALGLSAAPGIETALILARSRPPKHNTGPRFFVANLAAATNSRPTSSLIPDYYRNNPEFSTWFCLSSELRPLSEAEAKAWVVASSGQALPLAIKNCPRTYLLLVRKSDRSRFKPFLDQTFPTYKGKKPQPRSRPHRPEEEAEFDTHLDPDS
jgi:hypothetical protein